LGWLLLARFPRKGSYDFVGTGLFRWFCLGTLRLPRLIEIERT
jgi:hypothetical protein